MYCKMGLVGDARKVFDRIPERNSVSWATMIFGYAMQRLAGDALELLGLMRRGEESEGENEFILTSVVSVLAVPEFVDTGKQDLRQGKRRMTLQSSGKAKVLI
ncbi:putative pentatricopeptide [Rosa chinensis]|uniref:Putative pentatricopeptide n=1 Tax=Rosa chinensis TaxID=74649 RepID=A0A2P6RKQ8_ROSCH|nr:putative pentatricopeptide [Rosa chinensis]